MYIHQPFGRVFPLTNHMLAIVFDTSQKLGESKDSWPPVPSLFVSRRPSRAFLHLLSDAISEISCAGDLRSLRFATQKSFGRCTTMRCPPLGLRREATKSQPSTALFGLKRACREPPRWTSFFFHILNELNEFAPVPRQLEVCCQG